MTFKSRLEEIMVRLGNANNIEMEFLTGISESAVRSWRTGGYNPGTKNILKISKSLGLSESVLLGSEPLPSDFPHKDLRESLLKRRSARLKELTGESQELPLANNQLQYKLAEEVTKQAKTAKQNRKASSGDCSPSIEVVTLLKKNQEILWRILERVATSQEQLATSLERLAASLERRDRSPNSDVAPKPS
jgi:transcriptional regulator with XRE-family HTH domain